MKKEFHALVAMVHESYYIHLQVLKSLEINGFLGQNQSN